MRFHSVFAVRLLLVLESNISGLRESMYISVYAFVSESFPTIDSNIF